MRYSQRPVTVVLLIIAVAQWRDTDATCYFPLEFQGEYEMQTSSGNGMIQYSTLNITENSIPIWGNCYRRIGNNFILMFNYSETSCIRCLHLKLRSPRILQVFASNQDTISKCFTNEESAEANCPTEESTYNHENGEILLFKTKDVLGQQVPKQYCPLDDNYYLKSNVYNNQTMNCIGTELDACPFGSTMNIKFGNCTVENYRNNGTVHFDCLGYWSQTNGEETTLILEESTQEDIRLLKHRPKYRCAVYSRDSITNRINVNLSKDAACNTNDYELLSLELKQEKPWPVEVSSGICIFPIWMQGEWEHVTISGDAMVYRDHTSFKTYTIRCVGSLEDSDKYLVFSRTQCGEESYNCIRVAIRSNNTLEFKIGKNSSVDNDVFTLCSDENFYGVSWITQGRVLIPEKIAPRMCPITGEYSGKIPDAVDQCAKLWSDCRAPELMYYQVSHCKSEEIYEEREYQCLGHWKESNLLYTYTKRNDIVAGVFECFVGSIISDQDIYIKEAGGHCQRNVDPLQFGMRLTKEHPLFSCIERSTLPGNYYRTSTQKPPTKLPTPGRTTFRPDSYNPSQKPKNVVESSSSLIKSSWIFCLYLYLCINNL